ncbi:hypothetical protein [Erythrobacter sp. WG]|uniref:hypothetical protein n=1 Tax=Erythrobacter sp. WG TaxID=2985510 RepID=UPI00226F6A58|nr:hypothetical protein [Erythrobacter sp. WG]MCX9148869.1 hypothetical protein [Erythrobacter sp. WG]
MPILLLGAALALQPAPPAASPPESPASAVTLEQLPLEQAAAARCAIAFATIGRWQRAGDSRGAAYPAADTDGGREFFVQVMAKLMERAGLSRDDVVALATRGVEDHDRPGGAERVAALMPACQMMKSAAGL